MMAFAQPVVQRFRGVVEERLGLDLHAHDGLELERLLHEQSAGARLSAEAYVEQLLEGECVGEWRGLANRLTVGETYFFRHLEQLDACCALILRACSKRGGRQPVRVLSAGCSSGEEPYSLAMLLREQGVSSNEVEIVGLDVNPFVLERARLGRYTDWSLRETPPGRAERWFRRERHGVRLDATILDAVAFVQGNLVTPAYELSGFDLVLCRNVLMYFTPEQFKRAASRLVRALRPDGALFLGHAESLRGLDIEVEAAQEFGTFFYRPSCKRSMPVPTLTFDMAPEPDHTLPASAASSREPGWPAPPSERDWDLVENLLQQERFNDALGVLDSTSSTGGNARVQLGYAALLAYCNRFSAAQASVTPLLDDPSIAAEAHYVLALCHEGETRFDQAVYHNRLAAHLDPTFAMPWLHLGLLHKRTGNHVSARSELLRARALLVTETPERLLWFGGGCSRASLLDVCRNGLETKGDGR